MSTISTKRMMAACLALGCGLRAVPTLAQIETPPDDVNRVSFGARGAFGIKATFKNVGNLTISATPRTTPNGALYNYDNGYVLTDSSGNQGGQTWNWGYDSSSQISGNTVLMSRSTTMVNATTQGSADFPDISPGFEITYNRKLGTVAKMRYGLEGGFSFLSISLRDSSTVVGDISQTTDAYSFANGSTPPQAPYQGTFNGPGFLIGSTPASSTTTVVPAGATITGRREFTGSLWGLRVGPYLEIPVDDGLTLSVSGGPVVGLLAANSSWSETVTISGGGSASGSGQGSDTSLRFGGYLGTTLAWKLAKKWDFQAGAQYQYLGTYQHTLGGRALELDLSRAISVSLGVSYSF